MSVLKDSEPLAITQFLVDLEHGGDFVGSVLSGDTVGAATVRASTKGTRTMPASATTEITSTMLHVRTCWESG